MVGFGETYFPAFALAVGLGELMAGLVASLPLLAGGIMQTISPLAIRRLRIAQAMGRVLRDAAGVDIPAAGPGRLLGPHRFGVALLWIVAVYWAAGLATGPAWNTWIGTLVPRTSARGVLRVPHARRAGGHLPRLPAGRHGAAMDVCPQSRAQLTFAALFAVAGLCRLGSVWMLMRHSEPTPIPEQDAADPVAADAASSGSVAAVASC